MSDEAKLQAAIDECVAVCRKHDFAGLIVVSAAEHSKFALPLNASWNYVTMEGDYLQIRTQVGDEMETKKQKVCSTVSALSGIIEVCAFVRNGLLAALGEISRQGIPLTFANTITPRLSTTKTGEGEQG